jgi:hypothetical protein
MMSKGIHQRLDDIEASLRRMTGNSAGGQWTELRRLFAAAPENAALLATAGAMAGTRSLPKLLAVAKGDSRLLSLVGQLRHRLGSFCQRHRLKCPESKLLKVRRIAGLGDRNGIVKSGDSSGERFIQLWECHEPE